MLECISSNTDHLNQEVTMIANSLKDEKVMKMIITSDTFFLQELIERGADVNGIYETGGVQMFPLANAYSVEKAELLISSGADLNKQNEKGQTALMLVNEPAVIEHLIKSGADCKILDSSGRNALFYHVNNLSVLKMLVWGGANPMVKDFAGISAYSLMSDDMKEAFKVMILELKELYNKLKENKKRKVA